MKRVRIFNLSLSMVLVVAAAGAALWWYRATPRDVIVPVLSVGATVASTTEPFIVPPPSGEEYKNKQYRFSLSLPQGFRAQELPVDENGGQAIVLQDEAGNGIQMYVMKDDGNNTLLSADDVRAAIPDMKVTNEQEVEIGPDNRGVAFMSDNEAFGGASREVWFYFKGNLYQISTYARLDSLLQSMFGTWKFF